MSINPNPHRQIPLINRLNGSAIFMGKHLLPSAGWLEKWRQHNIKRCLARMESGRIIPVTREAKLTKKDFLEKYLKKNIPVIFNQEAIDWNCCQKWNFDFFQSAFHDEHFSIIDSTGLNESDRLDQQKEIRKDITGSEFIESIRRGTPLYIRFCPILETHPDLRNDLNLSWLKKMRECWLGVSYQTFIGAKGRKTPLHSETTSFFYVMVAGKKKWHLYSPAALTLLNPRPEGRGYNFTHFQSEAPDTLHYPGADKLSRYVCELEKGDILFVPTWMWHEVENLSDSWGVSYRFTNLRGFLRYPSLAFIRLFLTKPSFLEILYYSFFKSDVGKRKKNPLTPKLFLRD